MFVIVGLGNPEKKFKNTPHNLGKEVLNFLQGTWKERYSFSNWRTTRKVKAQISTGRINRKKVALAKPLVFMNLSGESVALLLSYFKIKAQDLVVVHDDIDLPLGQIKIVKNHGAAGHKGVLSIFKAIGSKNFTRVRIGISPKTKPKNPEIFVLKQFGKAQQKYIKEIIARCGKAIETIVKEGPQKAMNDFNKKSR